jgi:hypothetical protein
MLLLLVASCAAAEPCCADMQALLQEQQLRLNEHVTLTLKQNLQLSEQQAQLTEQQTQLTEQKAQLDEQKAQMEELRELVLRGSGSGGSGEVAAPAPSATVKVGVEAAGTGRVLAESPAGSSLGAHSWLTHFFPDGHTCPNLDTNRPKMLLPVTSDGSLTWSPSPSDLPADANVTLVSVEADWATSEVQSFPNPFKIVHGADCTSVPTLELPLRTTMGGVDVGAPQLLYRYDFPVGTASGTHVFASGGWRDFPDLMYYPTLTKSSTLLLVHYQISWGFVNEAASFLTCRLYVDGNEATAARSIDGSGPYGTVSGTWIGTVSGPSSPQITVQCRNSHEINLYDDYMTKALNVVILSES